MKLSQLFAGAAGIVVVAAIGYVAVVELSPTGTEPRPPLSGAPRDLADAGHGGMSRGEYLTRAADCEVCHSAKGGVAFAGGRPFKLPFGTIYATNLTPDRETGIGDWSDDRFVRAVRDGVGTHGNLYPAMPYTSYTAMSREDVLAIKSYLFSLAPVHNPTPDASLSFPFNQRWGMKFWNVAFFRDHRFTADAAKGPAWNRGAYLADALEHCGECHTPRNVGFAMESHDYMAGTKVQGWKAYNTTSNATYGLGGWSDEQLRGYLTKGHAPGRSTATGPMGEVVEHSLQYLTPSDISALMVYLRSISPETGDNSHEVTLQSPGVKASDAVLAGNDSGVDPHGKRVFEGECAGCHQYNGVGRQTSYASLAGSHAVNDPSGTSMIQVILNGSKLIVDGHTEFMPAFGTALSDEDVAAVANYALEHFGNKHGAIDAKQVHEARQQGD